MNTRIYDLRPMERLTAIPEPLLPGSSSLFPASSPSLQSGHNPQALLPASLRRGTGRLRRLKADDFSEAEYWEMFMLPTVLMNMIFDFVDTVIDNVTIMRVPELKSFCRDLRQLREEYWSTRRARMQRVSEERRKEGFMVSLSEMMEQEESLGEIVLGRISGTMANQLKRIRKGLLAVEPDMDGACLETTCATMQAWVLDLAFLRYAEEVAGRAYAKGYDAREPKIAWAFSAIIPHFLGDLLEHDGGSLGRLAADCGRELFGAIRKIKVNDKIK